VVHARINRLDPRVGTARAAALGVAAAKFEDRFGSALAAGDFNNDGADDLAVGARRENLSLVEEAGAVNVLYGTAGGLTGTGSQLFTQDTPGVPEPGDRFGWTLHASNPGISAAATSPSGPSSKVRRAAPGQQP